jgi:bifunctional DNA-binding transcriptional regulator/antitoxin component of YhaV-PrlF toxin-antitoxin module
MMRPTVIGPVYQNKKRISVSRKRQITIPIEFFKAIGIKREVECYMQDDSIVIRPVRESGGEFAEQILADLISRGLSGEELLAEFKKTQVPWKRRFRGSEVLAEWIRCWDQSGGLLLFWT